MSEIKIDIQRTGFPVKFGELELWFDSSLENLRRFFDVEQIAQEKLKEAQEKAKHIHFPDDVNEDNLDIKSVDAALDLHKEFIAAQYDIIFGDGTFRNIYKKYSDIIALEKFLSPTGEAIAKQINKQQEERLKQSEKIKNEYLKKKAKKK